MGNSVQWIIICMSSGDRSPSLRICRFRPSESGVEKRMRKASLIFILGTGYFCMVSNSLKLARSKYTSEVGKVRSTSAHCQRGDTLLKIPNAESSIMAKQVVLFVELALRDLITVEVDIPNT